MDTLGIPINLDYAKEDSSGRRTRGILSSNGAWTGVDEEVSGICYPVACCHIVTGTLPGGYVSNTVAAISVYDRDGKPVAHDAVEWADHSSAETDEECYTGFNWAIRHKAADLGARSMFRFVNGVLCSSVFIDQDPEQGPGWFHERSYGKREKDERLGNERRTMAGNRPRRRPAAKHDRRTQAKTTSSPS